MSEPLKSSKACPVEPGLMGGAPLRLLKFEDIALNSIHAK